VFGRAPQRGAVYFALGGPGPFHLFPGGFWDPMGMFAPEFAPGVAKLGLLVGRQRFEKPNQPIAPVGIRNGR
jgi:hypothetical protein